MKKFNWTYENELLLKYLIKTKTIKEIALILCTSVWTIWQKVKELGLNSDEDILINNLTHDTLAYIAGIIDGEGSINISKEKGGKNYVLRVTVNNIDPNLIIYLKENVGGSIFQAHGKINQRRSLYNWVISAKKAGLFLKKILPYLIIKKDQAETAILFQSTTSQGILTNEIKEKREELRQKIIRLHHTNFDYLYKPGSYFNQIEKMMKWLSEKNNTIFIGQSVLYTGTAMFNTVKDLPINKRIELPVAENLQMGMSIGLAIQNFIPISIFPRINFLLYGLDQMINHLDKMMLMSDGGYKPKVIIRTAIGSESPLDPGWQHKRDLSDGLKKLCYTINVVKLEKTEQIVQEYKKAYERMDGVSSLLIEDANYYNTK